MSEPIIKQFINGTVREGRGGETMEKINPATGEKTARLSTASEADLEEAVQAASDAFDEWRFRPGVERGRILRKAADLLRERNRELAEIEVEDTGKPIAEAETVDIVSGADSLEFFAGLAASVSGEHIQLGNSFAEIRREPLGVCGGIGAWNYPMQIACWKAAPALATGNTMVFKPAELTPRNALELAKIFREAGLPDGVFNVVQGGPSVGDALVRHPDVAKVSLTGEVETGKKVMEAASGTLKQVSLELGGKNPLLVFDDADLDEAVQGAMLANFYTQGEICSNGTRVYVHESVLDSFVEKLTEETGRLKAGDPMDPGTRIGALISEEHLEKVLSYIEIGKQEAELLFGGSRICFEDGSPYNKGYFVEPTLFRAPSDRCRIAREEIFGPVMTVLPFRDEEEVVHRANDTPYGLSAGLFTENLKRAHRVSARLEAGVCWINTFNVTPVEIPFGGVKQSGMGRENGRAAIDSCTQLKTVYVEMDGVGRPFD